MIRGTRGPSRQLWRVGRARRAAGVASSEGPSDGADQTHDLTEPLSSMAIRKVTPTAGRADSTTHGGKHRRTRRRKPQERAPSTTTEHHGTWNDKHWRWVADRATATGASRATSSTTSTSRQAPLPRPRAEAAASAPSRRAGDRPRPANRAPPAPTRAPSASAQATRLLNRAGFGPAPGQAEQLASLGLVGAVQSLTRPSGAAILSGPAPIDDDGNPLAPADAWGHDHLWWLDRMVRTNQPLVERMALVFHDWFATSEGGVSQAAADDRPVQPLPRRLLRLVPRPLQGGDGRPGDAAVAERRRKRQGRAERELRPRDDGAVQPRRRPRRLHRGRHPRTGAGADRLAQRLVGRTRRPQLPLRPQTPRQRAEDGLRPDRQLGLGRRLPALRRTPAPRLLLRRQALELLRRRAALRRRPRDALDGTYVGSRLADPPGRRGDPRQPRLLRRRRRWSSRRSSTSPAMLRALGRYIDTDAWVWLCDEAGQQLFWPPNVAGWDDTRWLDTSPMRARWNIVDYVLDGISVDAWDATPTARPRPPRKR